MNAINALSNEVGISAACRTLNIPRASWYRHQSPRTPSPRPPSHRALSEVERTEVLDTLNSPRFGDHAPAEVYATLLDESTYLCSISTMYRLLRANDQVKERRDQLRRPKYKKPELLATGPRQLWSWDITKLKGPRTWCYYYLYVILDVFSRYVVGWMLAEKESAVLAKKLIAETLGKEGVEPGTLTLHADRGSSMKSKPVAHLLADLGITKTHSRPYVSDDNPYSESQFKTLKYRPDFPKRFGCIEDGRAHCRVFFPWYNHEHKHHGLALLTPADVHFDRVDEVLSQRQRNLDAAFSRHPERFPKPPSPSEPDTIVWINPPVPSSRPAAACPPDKSGAELMDEVLDQEAEMGIGDVGVGV